MKLTLIGTGILGGAIAQRLLDCGHEVTVWNRTRAKVEGLRTKGAQVADSVPEAIKASSITLTVLRDGPVTKEVLLAKSSRSFIRGRTVIQMGTVAVKESVNLESEIHSLGGSYLEAPVLGSTPEAKEGSLYMMAAGRRELFDRLHPLLSDLSEDPRYLGSVGKAAALKLSLNQLLVGLVGSFGLSLAMVREAAVSVDDFMEIVRNSSLHSEQFEKKLPRMMDRDFSDPHFPVTHILKDVDLILEEGNRHGLGTEALKGFQSIIKRTLELGYESEDYSALYNGIHPPKSQSASG